MYKFVSLEMKNQKLYWQKSVSWIKLKLRVMLFRIFQLFEVIFAPLKNHGLLVIISKLVFIDDTCEKILTSNLEP